MEQLDSATYWEWAERLPAYPGMLQATIRAELAEEESRTPSVTQREGRARAVGSPQGQKAPATARELETDPATQGLFDY